MRQRDVINLSVVVQQRKADCAIAAVAMLLGRSYAEVYHANALLSASVAKDGATDAEIKRLVMSFGAEVIKITGPMVDLDADTGLLSLKGKRLHDWHLVVLFRGVLIDPGTGLLWNPEFYLQDNPNLSVEYLLAFT